jgi:hypothetical protein
MSLSTKRFMLHSATPAHANYIRLTHANANRIRGEICGDQLSAPFGGCSSTPSISKTGL